jgi:outer membrane protein TolC
MGVKMRARMMTVTAMLAASAASGAAQISFSSAIALALKNDPRVNMADAAVQKAEAGLKQTYDVYIPTIGADAGYGRGVGVPTSLPTIFTLSAQSLVFNFSQRDNIRAAASGVEAAKLSLKETQAAVEEDVATTYLNLESDQRRLEATTQEEEFAQRLVSIVQQRLDAGADTRINLLQAQRTAKLIELAELHLKNEIATLSDHLGRIIGLPGNTIFAVSGSIPALPPPAAIANSDSGEASFGVRAALAGARSKQELAFGVSRYRLRPQIVLGFQYSRIDTGQSDYTTYYPQFLGLSENAESVYLGIHIPIFDRGHQDQAAEALAEATRAHFEAESDRNQFLLGRGKLRQATSELVLRSDLAEIDRDIAQEQLNAVLVQLSPDAGSASADKPQLTPKDEQNARVAERAKAIDLLDAQFQLSQAEISLLRQTGQLDAWVKSKPAEQAATTPSNP